MRLRRASAGHHAGRCLALVAGCVASGCGFVFQGTHQAVTLTSQPPGAQATFAGERVTTPGQVRIQRQEWAVVRAEKDGYEPACRMVGAPRNILLSLLDTLALGLGWVVDKPTDALRRFPSDIDLVLHPLPEGSAAARLPTDWEIFHARRRGDDLCAASYVRPRKAAQAAGQTPP